MPQTIGQRMAEEFVVLANEPTPRIHGGISFAAILMRHRSLGCFGDKFCVPAENAESVLDILRRHVAAFIDGALAPYQEVLGRSGHRTDNLIPDWTVENCKWPRGTYGVFVDGGEVAATRASEKDGWAEIDLLTERDEYDFRGIVVFRNGKSGPVPQILKEYTFTRDGKFGGRAVVFGRVEIRQYSKAERDGSFRTEFDHQQTLELFPVG